MPIVRVAKITLVDHSGEMARTLRHRARPILAQAGGVAEEGEEDTKGNQKSSRNNSHRDSIRDVQPHSYPIMDVNETTEKCGRPSLADVTRVSYVSSGLRSG